VTEPVIRFTLATKRFGAHTALDKVSLAVEPGECLGLLGQNGAGKTTLLKLALGLSRPTEGTVQVLGIDQDFSNRRARETLGWEPRVGYADGLRATLDWLRTDYLGHA